MHIFQSFANITCRELNTVYIYLLFRNDQMYTNVSKKYIWYPRNGITKAIIFTFVINENGIIKEITFTFVINKKGIIKADIFTFEINENAII